MSSRPLRIPVADDDLAMVGAITALVGTEGHQVITAYDGLTAVKRFREERPDFVLLDLAMPGPDGFTVAGQIRAAGQAPILVVAGESGEAAKVRALGIGADDYLTKPFGKAELLARIAAIMCRVDRSTVAGACPDRWKRLAPAGAGAPRGAGRRRHADPHAHRVPPARGTRPRGGDIVPHHQLACAWLACRDRPRRAWGLKPHLARLRSKVEAANGARVGYGDRRAVRGVGYRIPSQCDHEGSPA